MADAIAGFFEELGARGYEPLLRRGSGTIRFDIDEDGTTDRWLVTVARGTVSVRHRGGAADCVVGADRALFLKIATGRANAMAAVLRGALAIDGDPSLLSQFQRVFPGPPTDGPGRHRGRR